ncbi:SDR family NAD(P)-dependent oxidoreductase [Micromonospora tarensis]|uniref:SDR family NAD(P)-dependent oxidoreductase n=1 Tax=Micromonospora tarensis TaxID=2806100 RepID=A0ABS1YDI0_9ACTN|nr:SDR family NAD(P)-dependent oxidoreductase [Micromonospora tarensis]MBM0275413.1 SDR family NAD(P)-dependent oxidoreductase [Micromonospora tarensis]
MSAKTAVITGASDGLGAHLATRLAEEGWRVTGVGRRPHTESSVPAGIDYVRLDLARPDAVEQLLDRLGETPDLVVQNAVSYPAPGDGAPSLTEMEDVFRVNALTPYRLALGLLDRKPPEQFVSCIVINSESIYHADDGSGLYAASKAALRVLSTALATRYRSRNASVATLLLGPLADAKKVAQLRRIAEQKGLSEQQVTALFLRRSNPDLVIDQLIDFDSCHRSVAYLAGLGPVANGMLCRLDGGSAGSLI